MEGVVTILNEPHYRLVEGIWREVNEACGRELVHPTDIPHFSWHVAESYEEAPLAAVLEELCAEAATFTVQSAGLGMFTSEKCVLYITLVKDETLLRFHQQLFERLQGVAVKPSPYYAPLQWVPHITLAHENVGGAELSCAIQSLACRPLLWKIKVDHLAVIGEGGLSGGRGVLRVPFGKPKNQ